MTLPALGIDVGLSGARAAVVNSEGRLLGSGRVPAKNLRRRDGVAERRPVAWFEEAIDAAGLALAEARCEALGAIGIGALGPCPILLDAQDRALAPAPLFSLDRRAEGHRRALAEIAGLGLDALSPDHAM